MNVGVFAERPDCRAICTFLGRTIHRASATPRYIVCDRDSVFDCNAFRRWVKRRGIRPPRYGAVGKHGSIAVVERSIRTMKDECTRQIVTPMQRNGFRAELVAFMDWYNEHPPHAALDGSTPNEVYFASYPAHRRPRFEPRSQWPRTSPCARPQALVAGQPGARFRIEVEQFAGRRHLPVVHRRRPA
jgi:transposase InsO family protein